MSKWRYQLMAEELIFRLSGLFLFLIFMGIRGYYGRKAQPEGQKRTRQKRWADQVRYESKILVILRIVLVYTMIVFVLIWSLFPILIPAYTQIILVNLPVVRWIGVAICIAMILGMTWVGIHLDRQVSGTLEIKEGHTMVTSGPYTYIRHPMYLVYFIFNIGLFLITLNLILLVIVLFGLLVIASRMRVEEEMMIEQFGDRYREYMEQTGRLFPRVRRKKDASSEDE
ncbi:MAG: isoprenylcysteine carboxylmethyltransferase family protein [Promethearchaeota archaeon]